MNRTTVTRHAIYPTGQGERRGQVAATGEYRPPRVGEWYLSGAIVEGYQARADLETPYWIARNLRDPR